jgi:hypothetical protein
VSEGAEGLAEVFGGCCGGVANISFLSCVGFGYSLKKRLLFDGR